MFTGDRAKRIEQLKSGLKWFVDTSTATITKLKFDTAIDTVSIKDRDNYIRYEKLMTDISDIYMSGTEEEKKKIDSIMTMYDKRR